MFDNYKRDGDYQKTQFGKIQEAGRTYSMLYKQSHRFESFFK